MPTRPEQSRFSNNRPGIRYASLALATVLSLQGAVCRAAADHFLPLPDQVLPSTLPSTPPSNPLMDLAGRAISGASDVISTKIPDSLVIRNDSGQVTYDSETHSLSYTAGSKPLFLRTGEGQEIYARGMRANMDRKESELIGPLVIYQGETLTLAEGGYYNWEKGEASVTGVKTKANGLIIRGSGLDYKKDAKGENYLVIHHAFVTTEDVEKPGMWVGTGQLTVYPGDRGIVSRLSLATDTTDVPVPILGWIPLSHSLNPREGYMPIPGVKSIWGAYLKNSYGILLGNRRVEHGMPVSDYVATLLLDYRVRRGLAGGLNFTDEQMDKAYHDMEGLATYYAADKDPNISPTGVSRENISGNRYRIALQSLWDLKALNRLSAGSTHWSLATDINVLSDKYMLQDFFVDQARVNDKPDNNVRLERRTPVSQTMLFTRFSPNNFYSTDERTELSYYRARSALGNTRITYETRNSAGVIRQDVPADLRLTYKEMISELRDPEMRDYYTRLLNTRSYARVNTTHELSTSFSMMKFLNITPKAGGGYTGYYNVENVGEDNRFLGYLSCDFDIKFYRHFSSVRVPSMGINELYHVIHPYATVSHGTISSSNSRVPEVDTWSNTIGSSTINPMPLDLMGFTGVDGWGKWTIWRLGAQNVVSTIYDNETRTLLNWNIFIDYNIDNPNSESVFSNLYSIIELHLNERFCVNIETQTPTIRGGDGFNLYNTSIIFIPTPWLEAVVGHRYINNHPVQVDASQMYVQANIRLNEKYTFSAKVYWDLQNRNIPIQQYSLSRKFGAWYVGSTLILRNNGGRKETGFGLSFTLGETATSLPVNFF